MTEIAIASEFEAFASFTEAIWIPGGTILTEVDHTIMGLGLVGETGEALEELVNGRPTTATRRRELVLEMGDAIHYWARIAKAHELDVGALVRCEIDGALGVMPGAHELCLDLYRASLMLAGAAGRVAEVLKKRVRDSHFDRPLFEASMARFLRQWMTVCSLCEIDPSEVLRENNIKMVAKYGDRIEVPLLY